MMDLRRAAALLLTPVKGQGRQKPEPQEIGKSPLCHTPRCINQSELCLATPTTNTGGKCCCTFCDKGVSMAGQGGLQR